MHCINALWCLCAGKDGSYGFFSGVDASRGFLTGDFTGDLNDNVTDFTPQQMAGLVRWKDFYLKVCMPLFCAWCQSPSAPRPLFRIVSQ